jgi:hypothetical protein
VADNKHIKAAGLRFARGLQMAVKTAIVFTIEHKSVERPIHQTFESLNKLLKETGQFTFGFVDNQVMLNNLLTNDPSLHHLETEFLKRGIAAVTFEPGLTVGRFRKVISILSASTTAIDETGGILSFLENNQVEGARILPAARNQKKDEQGDTIIDTDSEAYILSKQMADEQRPRDFLDSLDALMESGCFDPNARSNMLSEFAAREFDGAGYGVPISMPNLVALKEGEVVVSDNGTADATNRPAQAPESGTQARVAQPVPQNFRNGANGTQSGLDPDVPNSAFYAPANFAPMNSSLPGPGTPMVQAGAPEDGVSVAGWRSAQGLGNSGSGTFMDMVEASVQRSLLEDRGNPQKSYFSLARILRNMGVDKVLANFPAERQQELSSLPAEQIAAEYIEDTALQLAGTKLKGAQGHSQKILIEEDVVRVLGRSLQATHMADRLAQKLAKFIQDFAVPPHLQTKIREELQWSTLSPLKKYERLMALKHCSSLEFRRLLDLARELIKLRDMDHVSALATHYFEFLDEDAQFEVTELSRAPELIRSIPFAQGDFAVKTSERLGKTLMRSDLSDFIHAQCATALTVLAQSSASFENFQDVIKIGGYLEASANRDPEKHKKCCGSGLMRLLPAAAIERVIELFLVQRGDPIWSKSTLALLRYSAPASIESVFNHLIDERDARNRLALVRLIGLLGAVSIEVAHKYLKDERWYVVRNICGILSDLKDPDLADHITPALEHPDPRVQQAALKALIHSRTVRAAPVLAASLSRLAPNVLNEGLDELMFLKHPKSVDGLENFITSVDGNVLASTKAVQVLANIDDDDALHALGRLVANEHLDNTIRRAALAGLSANHAPLAKKLLKDLAKASAQINGEAAFKNAAGAK